MKKYFYLVMMLLTVGSFTSCIDDKNEDDTKLSFNADIYNRAVNGDNVVFSLGNAKVEVNNTQMTMQMTADFKDAGGTTHNVSTTEMKLALEKGPVYRFSGAVNGYIDLSTLMIWYTIDSGDDAMVYSTTQLKYPYLTSTVTSEDGNTYTHTQSGYIFAIDSKGQEAMMEIVNYVPDTGGAIQAAALDFSGLTVTPTATGYKITASEAKCSQSSYYNISDLDISITGNCWNIQGSFKIRNHTYTMSGKLFGDYINQ